MKQGVIVDAFMGKKIDKLLKAQLHNLESKGHHHALDIVKPKKTYYGGGESVASPKSTGNKS